MAGCKTQLFCRAGLGAAVLAAEPSHVALRSYLMPEHYFIGDRSEHSEHDGMSLDGSDCLEMEDASSSCLKGCGDECVGDGDAASTASLQEEDGSESQHSEPCTALEANLLERFPEHDLESVRAALQRCKGHGGQAARSLRDLPVVVPVRSSMRSNLETLSQRFPQHSEAVICRALVCSKGHAGQAGRLLARDGTVVPSAVQKRGFVATSCKCPCGRWLAPNRLCGECGELAAPTTVRICSCGESVSAGADFCGHCGQEHRPELCKTCQKPTCGAYQKGFCCPRCKRQFLQGDNTA